VLPLTMFTRETTLDIDPKEFITFRVDLIPTFEYEVYAEDARTVTFRDELGRVRKALKEGAVSGDRMSMDQYIGFPVKTIAD